MSAYRQSAVWSQVQTTIPSPRRRWRGESQHDVPTFPVTTRRVKKSKVSNAHRAELRKLAIDGII